MGLQGIGGYEVLLEVYISNGLPAFDVVGLPDAAVREARERVRAAIKNNGYRFPVSRMTVNLAPADKKKAGTLYDLPMFIGILAAIRSDDPAYRYSGYLTGFTYLSNALYAADRDAWQSLRDTLPDTVVADLRASNDYWAQFRSAVSRASDRVYDGFLKSNGDADGIRSYGTVTDLLVAYFA